MILENKLGITDQAALARAEEKISKQKARQLFDSGDIKTKRKQAPLPEKSARSILPKAVFDLHR